MNEYPISLDTQSVSEQHYLSGIAESQTFIRSLFFIEVDQITLQKSVIIINIYTAPTREKGKQSQRSVVVNNLRPSKSDT